MRFYLVLTAEVDFFPKRYIQCAPYDFLVREAATLVRDIHIAIVLLLDCAELRQDATTIFTIGADMAWLKPY